MNEKNRSTEAIDTLERFGIGGANQYALIRGRHRTSPVLLLIQGGPGLPMISEASALERQLGLEEHFRVVYWDQRGTGKSIVRRADGPTTVADLVADIRGMVDCLCERLAVPHLHVVGFSIGASLALLAAAEDSARVRSLVCVGLDVNLLESERFAYSFAMQEAARRGERRALRALHGIGEPPHDDATRFMTRVKWVSNYGGVHRGRDFGALTRTTLARLLASPHYSLVETLRAVRGMTTMQKRLLPNLRGFDVAAGRLQIDAPIAVFHGRHDVAAPPDPAAVLTKKLGAKVVWFENSAHMPHEEEPDRFRGELLRFMQRASNSRRKPLGET